MKKTSPAISVMMLNYNYGRYLGEAIESILNQTFDDFELIIYDDASNDNSVEVIKKYSEKDSRIVFMSSRQNRGEAYGRNQVLKKARGKYIAILDSDDKARPHRLEKQYRYMERHPEVTILGGGMRYFGKTNIGKTLPYALSDTQIRAQLLFGVSLANPTTLIRKKFFEISGILYDEKLPVSPDYMLWVMAMFTEKYPVQFANLEEVLIDYRWHGENISGPNHISKMITSRSSIDRIMLSKLGLNPSQENMQKHFFLTGNNFLKSKDKDVYDRLSPMEIFQKNRSWLQTLVEANDRVGWFSRADLYEVGYQKVIGQMWGVSPWIKWLPVLFSDYRFLFFFIKIVCKRYKLIIEIIINPNSRNEINDEKS